ncbi:MAG: heme o synthase [Alphaproteobacteria bacterium]
MALARELADLFKLRIGAAVTLSAVAGMATVEAPPPDAWRLAAVAAAVLVSSASAGAFNQLVERDLDGRMRRTRERPFVTGRYTPGPAWYAVILGLLALAVAGAALATNPVAALHVFLGAFVYGVVYTLWLKRRTWWNIVVGGLAGSFAVLAGAAALDPTPSPAALALAVVLFLWTPPHFWSLATVLKDDYAAAGVPMLPVVVGERRCARAILANSVVLVVASLAPAALGLGWAYLGFALVGGWVMLWRAWRLVRDPGRSNAMRCFAASLVQLLCVLVGAMVGGWSGA